MHTHTHTHWIRGRGGGSVEASPHTRAQARGGPPKTRFGVVGQRCSNRGGLAMAGVGVSVGVAVAVGVLCVVRVTPRRRPRTRARKRGGARRKSDSVQQGSVFPIRD
jgi:hypothetical protein